MSGPGLRTLKRASKRGHCVICGDAFIARRHDQVLCGERECRLGYFRAHRRDQREARS